MLNAGKILRPTVEQLRDAYLNQSQDWEQVHEQADLSWHHGVYMNTVFRRIQDQTYWMVGWRVSHDEETHTLRDGKIADDCIWHVEPYERVIVDYRVVAS